MHIPFASKMLWQGNSRKSASDGALPSATAPIGTMKVHEFPWYVTCNACFENMLHLPMAVMILAAGSTVSRSTCMLFVRGCGSYLRSKFGSSALCCCSAESISASVPV